MLALYKKDWETIKTIKNASFKIKIYDNFLWNDAILWIVENPKIFLELSADLRENSDLGSTSQEYISIYFGDAYQDARRLAFLYKENPSAFRKIYIGMVKYITSK